MVMETGMLIREDMSILISATLGDLAVGDVERCKMRYRGVITAYASVWIRRPEIIVLVAINHYQLRSNECRLAHRV